MEEEIGKIETFPCLMRKHIEWVINDFFSVTKGRNRCISPPFYCIDGSPLYFLIYPKGVYRSEYIEIILRSKVNRECLLDCNIGLKTCDGGVEPSDSGVMKKHAWSYPIALIKGAELLWRKAVLAPGDVLTITCTMKWMTEICNPVLPTVSDKTKYSELISLEKLSENLKDFFEDKETSDVTLKVKDKEYKAHRSILMARSSVFLANFKHDTLERQTGVITISDCDPDSFQEFLEYLYSGKLEELSFLSALNLYYTSDKYEVKELKAFCIEHLMRNLTVENVSEIAVLADKHDETQLFSSVQDFFNQNSCKVFLTSEWNQLLRNDYRLASRLLTEMAKMKLQE